MTHVTEKFDDFLNEKTMVISHHEVRGNFTKTASYILDGVDAVYMEVKEFSDHIQELIKNLSLATASATIVGASYLLLENLTINSQSIEMMVITLGATATLALPKIIEEAKKKIQDIYPPTAEVTFKSGTLQREIERHGDSMLVRHDVVRDQNGKPVRQVSCDTDWAIITPFKKIAMVNGEKAYTIHVMTDDQMGITQLMPYDTAMNLLKNGVFGDMAELKKPTQDDINILKTQDISTRDPTTLYCDPDSAPEVKYG
jgi:hypothetical protein